MTICLNIFIALAIFLDVIPGAPYLISILFMSLCTLYLFDFLTFGLLRKTKYVATVYYPVYRFMSWITLSFLYRGFLYAFLTNITKWRVGLVVVGLFGLCLALNYPKISRTLHWPNPFEARSYLTTFIQAEPQGGYEDRVRDDLPVYGALIDSYNINTNHLNIFIPYLDFDDNVLDHYMEEYNWSVISRSNNELLKQKAMQRMFENDFPLYDIYLNDSLVTDYVWIFETHPITFQQGFLTSIRLHARHQGYNVLRVDRHGWFPSVNEERVFQAWAYLPFYKE